MLIKNLIKSVAGNVVVNAIGGPIGVLIVGGAANALFGGKAKAAAEPQTQQPPQNPNPGGAGSFGLDPAVSSLHSAGGI